MIPLSRLPLQKIQFVVILINNNNIFRRKIITTKFYAIINIISKGVLTSYLNIILYYLCLYHVRHVHYFLLFVSKYFAVSIMVHPALGSSR